MRILNVRLLAVLIVGTVAAGGVVHVVHGYQMQRHADVFLRESRRAQEERRIGEAIDYLQRYVTLAPDDTKAVTELGFLYADAGWLDPAYMTFERVLRQEPGRDDVRRRLVQVAIGLGRHSDAREHLERHLLDQSPEDGELLDLLARCQEAAGEYGAAVQSLSQAVEYAPDRFESYARLADLLRERLGDSRQAVSWLDRMVARNPGAYRAYLVRGTYRLEHPTEGLASDEPEPDEAPDAQAEDAKAVEAAVPEQAQAARSAALADARRAQELAPDEGDVLLFAARCWLDNGDPDEARACAERCLELHPEVAQVYSVLAEVELKERDHGAAMDWLQRGIQALPGERDLLWNLASLQIDQGGLEPAEESLKQLRAAEYPHPPVAYLEARLLVHREQWLAASRRLEGLRASLAPWTDLLKQADFWLGRCYEQLGNADLQLAAYRRAVSSDPLWVPARLGMAGALISIGRIDEALQEYRQVVSLPGAPAGVVVDLARLMILANLRRTPSRQNWNAVDEILDQAERIVPESPHIPVLRAEALVARDRDQEAEDLLTAARERMPDRVELWLAAAALAQRRESWDRAAKLLDETEAHLGDSVALRLARARHAVRRSGEAAKDQLKRLSQPAASFSPDEVIRLYDGLASLFLTIGESEQAERLCTLVAEEQPNNLRIRLLLFDLAFRAERTASMERVLGEVRRIEGTGPLWRYGEAVRLSIAAQEGRPELFERAREHLAVARTARPAWSRIPLLLAQIGDLQADEDGAIENYVQAIELGERHPAIVGRTVGLLFRRKRFVEADQLIRRLQEQQSPFSGELTLMASEISLRLEDSERALSLAQRAARDSRDVRDHIWLGQVLGLLGRHPEAEEALRRAIQLDETVGESWAALIQFFGRSGQTEKAEAAIAEARQKIAADEAPLVIAQCYESIGRLEQAERQYQAALDAAADDPHVVRQVADFYLRNGRTQEAEVHLRQLAGRDVAENPDLPWARRNLALILTARGGREELSQAQSLIEQNLSSDDASDADRRAKAIVLASSSRPESRREAIRILEALVERRHAAAADPSGEDRFVLAQLYRGEGNWAKVTGHMRQLLATHPQEPRYVVWYVDALLRQGEPVEAELLLTHLARLAPQQFSTVALRARALFQSARYDETLALLGESARALGDQPDAPSRLRRTALLLENFARQVPRASADAAADTARFLAEAEALYRTLVEQHPDEGLVLAAFYWRQGRGDEGLDELAARWEAATAEEIANVSAAAMLAPAASAEQLQQVEQVLRKAIDERARPAVLLLALADLQNWAGRFADAEPLYREILRTEPRHVVALNNLALVLALHKRQFREALDLINRAIEAAGPNAALLDTRATIALAAGDEKAALADIERVLGRQPSALGYFHQAQANHRSGRETAARESLAKAHELGLTAPSLHPLERNGYRQLQQALR